MKGIWIILLFSIACGADAQEVSVRFEEANTLYRNGDYQKAVTGYEDILKNGFENAAVYYNLGNTYFKLQNIPAAILNYERARRLSPHDEDIVHNLRLANLRVVDKIEPLPQLFLQEWWDALISMFSSDGWARAGIVALWIAVVAGAVFIIGRSNLLQGASLALTFGAFLVYVFSFVGMMHQRHYESNEQQAIVFSPTVSVKSAPDTQSMDLFVLHEGVKVELLDSVGDWRKIRLADGKIGWLQEGNIGVI